MEELCTSDILTGDISSKLRQNVKRQKNVKGHKCWRQRTITPANYLAVSEQQWSLTTLYNIAFLVCILEPWLGKEVLAILSPEMS